MIIKKFLIIGLLFSGQIFAQSNAFSVKEWTYGSQTPIVFYLSGDGGFNSFSTSLCETINQYGFSITALNSRSYFWDKKTPRQTAEDIGAYLAGQFRKRKNQQFALVGYSFGADVLPFVVNSLPPSIKANLLITIMLAPSTSTDFEIHISDMLGSSTKRTMDVVTEINKLGTNKVILVTDSKNQNFPIKNITLKNFSNEILQGSHHFDGETEVVAKTISKYLK